MDRDRTEGQIRRFPIPRKIVGALAIDLDRRKSRRLLLNCPDKPRQQREDLGFGGATIGLRRDRSVGVVGIGLGSPADRKSISFFSVLNEGDRLGGLSNATGRMPEARGSSVPACPAFLALKMCFSRDTALVDVIPIGLSRTTQPSMHLRVETGAFILIFPICPLEFRPREIHPHENSSKCGSRSRFTLGKRRRASILALASKPGSDLNRTSGANLRLIRRAISPRK